MSPFELCFSSLIPFVAVGALLLACSQGALAANAASDSPVNLLYNGSFEVVDPYLGSPDGWLHPLGKCEDVSGAPAGGRACLLDVEMEAPGVLLQEVSIDGRRVREVRLSGWCRLLDSGGGEFALRLRWHRYKRRGVDGRTDPAGGVRLSEADGSWHHLEGAFPVPEWADAVMVVAGFENGKGTAWIDDVRLEVPAADVESGGAVPNKGNLWDDPRIPVYRLVRLDPNLPRPSLLFRREDVPLIRDRIERFPWAREIFQRYQAQADEALSLKVEVPSHFSYDGDLDMNPEKERLTRPHRTLLRALYALALVHGITGDERCADKGKEILLGYARRYPSYPLTGYDGDDGDDQSRLTRQVLTESVQFVDFAIEYDLLYDAMTPEERETCEDFLRHGAHVILANHRAEGNHGCWRSAGIGLVGLALRDDKLVNAELFGRWGFMRHMLWDVLDGFWFEGSMGYEVYALRAMTALTEAAYNCGIDVYQGNDVYKSLFDNLAANVGPDGIYPPFNDNNYAHLQARFFEIAAARWGDESYRTVLADQNRRDLAALLLGSETTGGKAMLPQGAVWPAAGQAVLRVGEGRDAAFLAVDFGAHTGFHSHWDCLTFYYYNERMALSVDPVAHSRMYLSPLFDGWARATFAHNTISIDRANEKGGGGRCEFMEAAPYPKGVGVATDAAYEGVFQRRALFLVDRDYLLCLDRLESDSEHTYDWNYHGPGAVQTDLPLAEAAPEPGPGYANLQSARVVHPRDPWQAWWQAGSQGVRLTADFEPGDEVRTGEAPQYSRSMDSSALTIRRQGTSAEFAAVVRAVRTPADETGFSLRRDDVVGGEARGTRVVLTRGDGADTLLLRWGSQGSLESRGIQLDGQYAWMRQQQGRLERLVLAQGRSVRLEEIGLRASEPGTCEVTRTPEGGYEVVWSGEGETRLDISGLGFRPDPAVTAVVLDAGAAGKAPEVRQTGGAIGVTLEPGERIVLSQR
jgi:hypothetical protein